MLRSLQALARLALALLASSLPAAAAADSWAMPERRTFFSADRQARLIVTPNRRLARFFREGPASAQRPAGQARGRLERRGADGRWRTVWDAPLVNDVSPVSALVADSGEYVVTFDDWGGVGVGDDVVVIYGPGGRLVRSLRLTDLLPEDYVLTLPMTVGSIWWSGLNGEHYLAGGGDQLVLRVSLPAEGGAIFGSGLVDLEVDLASGRPARLTGPAWERALAAAAPIRAEQRAAEQRRIAFLTEPLTGPPAADEGAWYAYLVEAYFRLDPGWRENSQLTAVLGDREADDYALSRRLTEGLLRTQPRPRSLLFGSPDPANLAAVLAAALRDPRARSLADVRVYIAANDALWPRFVEMFAQTGADIVQLDPSLPIPQRPERLPRSP